jgi:16S rRNA C967 or C1407 C5-methylase (RsmB/RsmF family)/NOL1/NOP2/fmu family ribosome biogenesis protein
MELPDKFIEYITKLNAEVLNGLCDTLANTAPSVSVRPNRLKGITAPEGARRVPWHDAGFYLAEREQFTFDPAMHQGLYYVQDASSMIVGTIVAKLTGDGVAVRYLDACAAPGGKTTAAIDALPTGSLVVANEYVPQRAAILAENVMKWGYPRIVVTRGDTARYTKLPAFFDIIATDVPCSGEGMMRKDAEAVAQWSPALVEECAQRQRMIVDNLWGSLRTGGYLIYSTCTFNRIENEEMVDYIVNSLGGESVDMNLDVDNGIDTPHHCYRFMPHHVDGEGLFVAVIRKTSEANARRYKPEKVKLQAPPREAQSWISGEFTVRVNADSSVNAYPTDIKAEVEQLLGTLDVVSYSVEIGTIKGKDLIPAQGLALSTALNDSTFPAIDVDYPTAISYLRREAISLPEGTPRGYVLLRYNAHPLGFVKNLGNRANNLYPQNWRILSQFTPDAPPRVIEP